MQTAVQRRAKRLPPPERRDQVLDAARGLILRLGYAGLSMNAVAREARVTRPVVYDFFTNRENLLQALLLREEERAVSAVLAAAPDLSQAGPDVGDLVVEATIVFLRAVRAEPDTWRLVLLPSYGAPDVVQQHIETGRTLILRQLEAVARRVLDRLGGFSGLDQELMAEFVFQFCERSIRLMLADPGRFPAERIVALVRQFTTALRPGSP